MSISARYPRRAPELPLGQHPSGVAREHGHGLAAAGPRAGGWHGAARMGAELDCGSSFASVVILALKSFEIGQPVSAASAALRKASCVAPGTFAVSSRCDSVMLQCPSTLSSVTVQVVRRSRHQVRLAELGRQRHREAAGVGGRDQLFGVGSPAALEPRRGGRRAVRGRHDQRSDRLRLRHVNGMAALDLDHRRTRPFGHGTLGVGRDHPVFGGDQVPVRLRLPRRLANRAGECSHAPRTWESASEGGRVFVHVSREGCGELRLVEKEIPVLRREDRRHGSARGWILDQRVRRAQERDRAASHHLDRLGSGIRGRSE